MPRRCAGGSGTACGNGEKGKVNSQKLNTHGGHELALTVGIGSSSSAASTRARFAGELQPSSSSAHDAPPPDPCPPGTLRFACCRAMLSALNDAPDSPVPSTSGVTRLPPEPPEQVDVHRHQPILLLCSRHGPKPP